MKFQVPCLTMWIVGLTIRHPLLQHLCPLRLAWRLPVRPFGLSVPSAWLPSVGGSFSTHPLPPLWCLAVGGSRRSFGCAAPSVLLGWAGVAVVFGVPLGGVLGGCCGLSPLCCSSSSGRGWLLCCSVRLPRSFGSVVPSLSSGDGGGFSFVLGVLGGRGGGRGEK